MPVYEYEHRKKSCRLGKVFEVVQGIKEDRLERCPECGEPIERLISRVYVNTPTGVSDYKNMGFTRLEKRDDGVYENVTAGHGEARYMERGKAETLPNLKGKITD